MLQFNNIILHNFGSYSHTEVDLKNKGFCLVTGENKHTKDNALSNGAGKSFIWSGICFAITGETIQGLKSGLRNINSIDEATYVILDFNINADHYIITRYIAPKSDLKIIKNDIDVSGKGIRESEAKLAELLPDLTQDFIASVCILGQGMPNKFSAFKPSGRKELLEKLTKSDFMVEDIKNRISTRANELNSKLREIDDKYLADTTKLSMYSEALMKLESQNDALVRPDFDKELIELETQIIDITKDITEANKEITGLKTEAEQVNQKLFKLTQDKAKDIQNLSAAYQTKITELKTAKAELETHLKITKDKIEKFKANPDICPTCGQKLPNADHILAERDSLLEELNILQPKIDTINDELQKAANLNSQYLEQISNTYDNQINCLNQQNNNLKNDLRKLDDNVSDFNHYLTITKEKSAVLTQQKANWDNDKAKLLNDIEQYKSNIIELTDVIKNTTKVKEDLAEHLQRIKWLDTLTKRDFRGFILSDIINYLDQKAKNYSSIVFGHTDLNIYLDGNDLNISYNNKAFDNLSGGEKTRVDLIIQFAIRDLLIAYMDQETNILVLDEVTDFLDSKSCTAVMSMLEKELKSIESVFIISHHAEELELPIDSEIHVIKNEDGISAVVS